jgi:hypothetical protein
MRPMIASVGADTGQGLAVYLAAFVAPERAGGAARREGAPVPLTGGRCG